MNEIIVNPRELLYKFGTIKKMFVYRNGFKIIGVGKNIVHPWQDIERITYWWSHYITNGLGHEHNLTLEFKFKDKTMNFSEDWTQMSIYVDLPSKRIKKLFAIIQSCGINVVAYE